MQNDLFGGYPFSRTCLAILVPLLLVLVSIILIRCVSRRNDSKWLKAAIAVGCAAVLSIFFFVDGSFLLDRFENEAVHNYVAHATPVLDKIKSQTGSYPSSLPISVLGEPPTLLKKYGEYSSDGRSFRFEYVDESAGWAGADGALKFESSDRQWKYDR